MIINIIGWIWLAAGIIFLIMPGILRWRIQKKGKKIIRRYLFAIAVLPAVLLLAIGFKAGGILPKAVMIIGLILLIKGIFLVKSKAGERIVGFLKKQPTGFFRLLALVQALIGLAVVMLR